MNTFAKLKDGTWGLRVNGPRPTPGTHVTVSKKSGVTRSVTIGDVLWSGTARDGQQANLCTIASSTKTYSSRGKRTGCSCGSIEDEPRKSDCATCRFENFDQ